MKNENIKEFINNGDVVCRAKIVEGFKRFNKKYGKYPSSKDIDSCEYLPSTRFIQRRLGGLVNLRKILGINQIDQRNQNFKKNFNKDLATKFKKEFYNYLKNKYGEIYVHNNSIFLDDNQITIDFKIFDKEDEEKNAAIITIYTQNIDYLNTVINIKRKKFDLFKDEFVNDLSKLKTYFVSLNPDIKQEEINNKMNNKKNKLDCDGVYSVEAFKSVDIFN